MSAEPDDGRDGAADSSGDRSQGRYDYGRVGTVQGTLRYVEQMPVAMMSMQGEDLRIVMANASYRASTGRDDLVGMTVREAFPEATGQGFFEMLDRVRTSGEPASMPAMRAELVVDDSGEATEFFFETVLHPAWDDTGHSCGVNAQLVDVTARVQAEHQALERARLAEQRYADALAVVQTLQEALLPSELPVLPRLDVAARYLLAGKDDAAGGDWFDAVVRPDGSVALVVGDVVGHGVLAAAVMGQLRAVLHDHLLSDETLELALTGLDRYSRTIDGAAYTTVCVVVVHPDAGHVEYCTAGHPPPIVTSHSGDAYFLEPTGAGPLTSDTGFPTRTLQLTDDATVVLYSDGLVERPGRPMAESTVELLRVVGDRATGDAFPLAEATSTTERLCQEVLEILTRVTGHADDITVLAARRTDAPPSFSRAWQANDGAERQAREAFSEWLTAFHLAPGTRIGVTHALSELVANAVRHAYRDTDGLTGGAGAVEIDATVDDDGTLRCNVVDHGTWQAPDPQARSAGLPMVRGIVDTFDLEHPVEKHSGLGSAGGTRARFSVRLGREGRLLTSSSRTAPGQPAPEPPFSAAVDGATVTVAGPVDLIGAAQLSRTLSTMPPVDGDVTVDLTAVTHLGSAGLRALHQASNGTANGTRLRLLAPNGTVAQQVLDLVQLPYDTGP